MAWGTPSSSTTRSLAGGRRRAPIASGAPTEGTFADSFADALEQHILPRVGDLYYDVLTGRDVQACVDEAILIGCSRSDHRSDLLRRPVLGCDRGSGREVRSSTARGPCRFVWLYLLERLVRGVVASSADDRFLP